MFAISILLRYLRTHSLTVFVVYRFVLAGLVLVLPRDPVMAAVEVMKQARQRAIRDLVGQRPIRTQQELAAALRERGFRTTQATISRDVAELGLIKVTRDGLTAYALPPRLVEAETSGEDRLRKLLADLPLEIHEAGLLLVLRTLPGSAHAIAAALDRARWPEVAGLDRRRRHAVRGPAGSRLAAARQASPDPPVRRRLTRSAGARRGRRRALTPCRPRDYHARSAGTSGARDRPRDAWSSFLYRRPPRPVGPHPDHLLRGGNRP